MPRSTLRHRWLGVLCLALMAPANSSRSTAAEPVESLSPNPRVPAPAERPHVASPSMTVVSSPSATSRTPIPNPATHAQAIGPADTGTPTTTGPTVSVIAVTTTTLVRIVLSTTSYLMPSTRPIIDGWRPPEQRYGAGNLGLELGTVAGDRLIAPQRGTVAFAGQVGGTRYLVINHPDGVRTTLGGIGALEPGVFVGASVRRGQIVAIANGPTHFGARLVRHYIDPGVLVRPAKPDRSWLVPVGTVPGAPGG